MGRRAATLRDALGKRPWLQAMMLTIIVLAIIRPTLDAGFVWDDLQQIVNSPTIADPTAPARYFTLNVVESYGSQGRGADGVDTYRPVFFLSLWLIHTINGPDSFWFHLAVLTAHLWVCLLIWTVVRRWVASDLAAAAAMVAFAVHPVTAEAYLWASAISEPLAAAGLLGSALILDRSCGRGRESVVGAAAAGLVLLFGLLAKEVILTALPAVSLYLWRVRGVRFRALLGPWIAVVVFLAMRVTALSGLQATGSGFGQRLEAIRNLPVLVLDGLGAMFTLRPVGIRHLYWDYHTVSWAASIVGAVAVGLLGVVVWRLRRRIPLSPTALGTTICMLAPVALISTVPGWGGFGRYLYLPWGFTVLAAAELGRRSSRALDDRAPRLRWAVSMLVVVFLAMEILGLHHALDVYRSQESLARASTVLQPYAPDGWEWLGNHHVLEGDLAGAARCYAEAVAIEPSIYRPRHNLAAALLYLGRPDEALEHEVAVRRIHGVTTDGTLIAVKALMELGRWDEADAWLTAGLQEDPTSETLLELRAHWLERRPNSEISPPPSP